MSWGWKWHPFGGMAHTQVYQQFLTMINVTKSGFVIDFVYMCVFLWVSILSSPLFCYWLFPLCVLIIHSCSHFHLDYFVYLYPCVFVLCHEVLFSLFNHLSHTEPFDLCSCFMILILLSS